VYTSWWLPCLVLVVLALAVSALAYLPLDFVLHRINPLLQTCAVVSRYMTACGWDGFAAALQTGASMSCVCAGSSCTWGWVKGKTQLP
jgi:hypothetical protein